MKNNMKERVLAAAMALAVGGAGLTGAYGYEKQVVDEVKAADEDTDENTDKDVEKLEETAGRVLEGSEASEEKKESAEKISKEESVYVKADPSGNVTETTVTEWLKNPGKGDVDDESELSDIKNVKGEETFSKGSGSELKWKSEGEDIYYQGTPGGSLPVGVQVSYKLNGKSISAKELNGKSGKVEINIRYTNDSEKTVKLDKKKVKMYTPFTMVTALMLPTDEYTNVEVDNGKVISDGDKNIVIGIGFPGLQKNLNLEETDLDIEIPDNVKITADVNKASVNPTVTMASAEILSEFNMDDIDSFDDLEQSLDDLEDAAQKLADGSKDAADGARELADGSKELADGTKKLKSGSGDLADGSKQVADGVSTLNEKSGDLIKGVNSLVDGVNTYTSGVGSLADGSKSVAGGAEEVDQGAAKLAENIGLLNKKLESMMPKASSAVSQADKTNDKITAAGKALDKVDADVEYTGDTKGKVVSSKSPSAIASENVGRVSIDVNLSGVPDEYREEIRSAIEKAENEANAELKAQAEKIAEKAINSAAVEITEERKAKAVVDTKQADAAIDKAESQADAAQQQMAALLKSIGELQSALKQLQEGAQGLAAGASQVSKGADTLAKGAEELNSKSSLLTSGTQELKKGGAQLASGVKKLDKGAGAVADGARKLDKGVDQLDNGAGTLIKGTNALADGNKELADGMSEFKEEGIDKLTETFDGDFQNVKDRLDAMSDMSKEYKSFAGIKKGMDGKTKFIIETEGIDEE